DAIATEAGEPRLPQTAELGSAHDHAPGRRPVESRDEVEQGRFSAAGRPHDGAELTPVDAQRDAVECAGDASLVYLRDVGWPHELAHSVTVLPPRLRSDSS